MTRTAQQQIRRAVKALRDMHDDGFNVDVLVEIAMEGRRARTTDDDGRRAIRDLYLEELGKKPKSVAALRGERAMKAFLAEKAGNRE